MRVQPAARRYFLVSLLSALALLGAVASPAEAASFVRFILDKRMDGAAVPFAVAGNRGLYRAENLEVQTNTVTNSTEALARLAKGDADIALADFNDLIRYRDGGNGMPLKAVFILHNENGYAIIARRSRGVDSVTDLQGKTLGVAEGDLAIRMWPAVAKHIGFDASKVKLEKIGAAVREPMLSAGQVDAVSGMSYASALNLRDRGVPQSDLVIIRFADFGDRSYGQALVVNPAFAAANPEAVSAFIRAVINAHPPCGQGSGPRRRRRFDSNGRRFARARARARSHRAAREYRHARGPARRDRRGDSRALREVARPDRVRLQISQSARLEGHLRRRFPSASRIA